MALSAQFSSLFPLSSYPAPFHILIFQKRQKGHKYCHKHVFMHCTLSFLNIPSICKSKTNDDYNAPLACKLQIQSKSKSTKFDPTPNILNFRFCFMGRSKHCSANISNLFFEVLQFDFVTCIMIMMFDLYLHKKKSILEPIKTLSTKGLKLTGSKTLCPWTKEQ